MDGWLDRVWQAANVFRKVGYWYKTPGGGSKQELLSPVSTTAVMAPLSKAFNPQTALVQLTLQ